MSDTESSTSSENSPNTHRWNKMEQILNETKPTTHKELKQKLREKIMIKQTRRMSQVGQNLKLDNMKQKMTEEDNKKNEESLRIIRKKDKQKEKKKKYKQRQKQKNLSLLSNNSNDIHKNMESIINEVINDSINDVV